MKVFENKSVEIIPNKQMYTLLNKQYHVWKMGK